MAIVNITYFVRPIALFRSEGGLSLILHKIKTDSELRFKIRCAVAQEWMDGWMRGSDLSEVLHNFDDLTDEEVAGLATPLFDKAACEGVPATTAGPLKFVVPVKFDTSSLWLTTKAFVESEQAG